MKKWKFGFTLGEVLIALGVIGVVASLTLPLIVKGRQATAAQAQFNTAYALISQAITEMETNNVSVNPANYNTARTFFPEFKKFFKTTVEKNYLFQGDYKPYRYLNNTVCPQDAYQYLDDGRFIINNGMDIFIENKNGNTNGLLIWVDINGNDKNPNTLGFDLFGFEMLNGGELIPVGDPKTTKQDWRNAASSCKYTEANDSKRGTGYTCAYFALNEPDYFKKVYHGH